MGSSQWPLTATRCEPAGAVRRSALPVHRKLDGSELPCESGAEPRNHGVRELVRHRFRPAEPDHHAYRGLPSVGYALTQGCRAHYGWLALAGNYVVIQTGGGVAVVLCHLRQGTPVVGIGDRVTAGQLVGHCGNSGNSTEPHLHLQALDDWAAEHPTAVPVTFAGALPKNRTIVRI